jgi:hypothetical protein
MHHVPTMATDIAPSPEPRRLLLEPSGKVRAAINNMIWQGYDREQAAKAAGLQPKSLYYALRKIHVKQYYLQQLDVLRTSAQARAFHRLEALSQQDRNQAAAVKACQVVLGHSDAEPSLGHRARAPGLIVQLVTEQPAKVINVTPVEEPLDEPLAPRANPAGD